MQEEKQYKVVSVTVYPPATEPKTFKTENQKIAKIETVVHEGEKIVIVEYISGLQEAYIGMPYRVKKQEQKISLATK